MLQHIHLSYKPNWPVSSAARSPRRSPENTLFDMTRHCLQAADKCVTSFTCARCHNLVQRKQILKHYDGTKSKSRAQNSTFSQATSSPRSAFVATSVRDAITDMFSSAEITSNPFLTEDSDYWAKTSSSKCRVPNCPKDADQNHLTCEDHSKIISPKSTKNSDRPHAVRHDSLQSNGSRPPPDASSPPTRKNLGAKTTARKTISRRPLNSAESRTNQNGHSSGVTGLQRPANQPSLGEVPAHKKQRLISPNSDEPASRNHAISYSPLALPSGFLYDKQNGDVPHPSRLPSLSIDLHTYSPRPEIGQERPRTILSTYGDYLSAPLITRPELASDMPKLSIGTTNEPAFTNGENGDLKTRGISRNASADRSAFPGRVGPLGSNESLNRKSYLESTVSENGLVRSQKTATNPMILKPASTRTTPSKVKVGQFDNAIAPSRLKSRSITRTPLLERQRRHLVEERSESSLDAYIYGQACSSAPPLGIVIEPRPVPELTLQDKGSFVHLDPRNHRTRPHSEEWYRQKEEEIKARGGRKANFGKAAQRMKEQRLTSGPEDFEASLPDRVRNNEDWLAATRWLRGRTEKGNAVQSQPAALTTPVRTKRKYTRRQPVAAAQPALDRKATGPDAV